MVSLDDERWQNLEGQGDVGVASYAAVPHLVRLYRQRGAVDWNTYAIVAVIELARDTGKNPEVPNWLKELFPSHSRPCRDWCGRSVPGGRPRSR